MPDSALGLFNMTSYRATRRSDLFGRYQGFDVVAEDESIVYEIYELIGIWIYECCIVAESGSDKAEIRASSRIFWLYRSESVMNHGYLRGSPPPADGSDIREGVPTV